MKIKNFLLLIFFCICFNFMSFAEDFSINALTETTFTEVLQKKTDKLYILENKIVHDEIAENLNNLKTITGWQCIKNENGTTDWYWTDETGNVVKDKWIYTDNNFYYLDESGKMVKNIVLLIKDFKYGFDDSGKLISGKYFINNTEYLSQEDGVLYRNQWVNFDNHWYYIGDNGEIFKNQKTPDGYDTDENGDYLEKTKKIVTENEIVGFNGLELKVGTASKIWNYLKEHYNWTDTAIAGVLGNFQQESQLDPNYLQSNGVGYGLGQWSFERRKGLETYMNQRNVPKNDLYAQLDYLMIEAGESDFVRQYSQTNFNSVSDAVYSWMKNWERCNPKKSAFERTRVPYGNAFYQYFTN